MSLDVIFWLAIAVVAVMTELFGLAGWPVGFRPLTQIVRGEMKRSSMFTGAVAAFLLWLVFHFLVQTWLP